MYSTSHSLVAKVSSMAVIASQVTVVRWCGTECNIRTKVILPSLAVLTGTTWHTRFYGNTVTCEEQNEKKLINYTYTILWNIVIVLVVHFITLMSSQVKSS